MSRKNVRIHLAIASTILAVVATGRVSAGETAMKTVTYRGVSVSVPADWPVFDVAADPKRCARLDEHAVYLGAQGADAACPAMLVGKTETVQLEPWRPGHGRGSFARRPAQVNGEDALVDPTGRAGGDIMTAFPRPRVLLTVTFGTDPALAEEIADSARVDGASRPSGGGSAAGSTPSAAETSGDGARPAGSSPAAAETPDGGAGAASLLEQAAVTAADQPTALQPGVYAGEGFDACTAQTREKMKNWLASPYRAVGIYIGGINRGCSQPELDVGWVADIARMGWSFIPTYVGLQAPCTNYTNRIDPAMASGQGSSAAKDAIAKADLIGLPSGSPIYFDMEAFNYSDTACRSAVLKFLSSWSTQLQRSGYLSGVYGSAGSTIRALVLVYNDPNYRRPNAIWHARWGAQEHSVWDDPLIPNTYWPNHQRIHQYRGGHIESWGGSTINIDNDFLDGPVVRRQAAARWISGDVSGDGKADLVHLCCRDYANTWLSNGDGTYAVSSFRPANGYGLQLGKWLAADVSGDGKSDLVHLCCGDYLNTWTSAGDGTYTVSGFRPWPGYGLQLGQWLAGDFTGDGKSDLFHLCCKDKAYLWISQGDGSFTGALFRPSSTYAMTAGSWRVADVDGNGAADLVHICCRDVVNVFLSQSNGAFTRVTYRAPAGYDTRLGSWTAADVTGDGKGDLVHFCCSDYLNTWISQGNGTFVVKAFRPQVGYAIQSGSWLAGNVSGTGAVDLVHVCCPGYINTWTSAGDGTYVVSSFSAAPGYTHRSGSWRADDLDANGRSDLVHHCCDSMLNSWLSVGNGTYTVVGSPI